jgi:tetratricopeptide (TPR) repeat protein
MDLGRIYYDRRQYDKATEQLGQALTYAPDYYESYTNYFAALIKLNRFAEAESTMAVADRQFPNVPDIQLRLAYARIYAGKLEEAEHDLNLFVMKYPGSRDARDLLEQARRLRAAPKPDSARIQKK